MSNITIQNNDVVGIVVWDPVFESNTIAAATATYVDGTVMGRITANGKLAPYDSGAVNGAEIPVAVIRGDVELTGADVTCKVIVAGQVRRADMVVHGAGAGITVAEADQLRDYGIITRLTDELSELDNQ